MSPLKRFVTRVLMVSAAFLGVPLSAQAAIVSTESLIAAETAFHNRARMLDFLERSEVNLAFAQQGVDAQLARHHVMSLSDEAVAELVNRMDLACADNNIPITEILPIPPALRFTR